MILNRDAASRADGFAFILVAGVRDAACARPAPEETPPGAWHVQH
jgi:hypothetical protein